MITLTEKDADWIANIIRNRITDMTKNYEETITSIPKNNKPLIDLCETMYADDEDIMSRIKELENRQEHCIQVVKEDYSKRMEEYNRILELVMCGSDVA